MKFTDFNLHSELLSGLTEAGYETCMPVQEQVLKNGLEGSDLYVQSQTGTGKTAAYLLIVIERLMSDASITGRKALIMVPTRELAVQVEEEARILTSHTRLKAASFYGGVGYGRQQELLKAGVDIIIGTPGRVIDLQESGTMDLSTVSFLVVDEADRMFDMGFYPDLRTLLKVLPKAENRQTMLFSATLNNWVKNLAWEYTIDAREVTIEAENITVDEIAQNLFHVGSDEKMQLLLGLIKRENPASIIVFCNTKRMSEVVSKRLKINGIESEFIIGDLPQSKRLQVIESFKKRSLRCLVATDVAARGIDVDDLEMVVNFDLPNEAENYVHRIGRTARAGKTGKAFSFCSEQDVYNLPAIEKYIEKKVPSESITEDLLVEDKSAGVFIRTDRYDSDYDDGDWGRGREGGRDRGGRGRPGDRSGGRGQSGGRGRPGERSDGRGRPGERSDGRGRPDGRSGGHDGRPDGRYGRGPAGDSRQHGRPGDDRRPRRDERGGQGRNGRREETGREEQELAKLSFEERMAYYKSKYGTEGAPSAEQRQQAAQDRRGAGSGSEDCGGRPSQGQHPRSHQGGGRRDERGGNRGARQGQNGHHGSGDRSRNARGAPNNAQRPAQGRGAPAAQQGRTAAARPAPAAAPAKKTGGLGSLLKKLFGGKKD